MKMKSIFHDPNWALRPWKPNFCNNKASCVLNHLDYFEAFRISPQIVHFHYLGTHRRLILKALQCNAVSKGLTDPMREEDELLGSFRVWNFTVIVMILVDITNKTLNNLYLMFSLNIVLKWFSHFCILLCLCLQTASRFTASLRAKWLYCCWK